MSLNLNISIKFYQQLNMVLEIKYLKIRIVSPQIVNYISMLQFFGIK